MTRLNAEADERKWHQKIPPPEEIATHPWQAARQSTRLLVVRALTVSHRGRSRRQRWRLALPFSPSPPAPCPLFVFSRTGRQQRRRRRGDRKEGLKYAHIITPWWFPSKATPRDANRHTQTSLRQPVRHIGLRVAYPTISIKSLVVHSFPIVGKTANHFIASNES